MTAKKIIKRDSKGRFTPGSIPNPNGRPKRQICIPDILRQIGSEEANGMSKLEVILRKVYVYASEGRPWAVQFIADRTEGKALERVQVSETRALEEMTDEEIADLLGE